MSGQEAPKEILAKTHGHTFVFDPDRFKIEVWIDDAYAFDLPCEIEWAGYGGGRFDVEFVQDETELSTGLSTEDPGQK